ncbi:MAG TPA: hypothetical protein VFY39_17515 [Gammaproteobacteria bacterium]|nr:hypothetical protein [Gammaproteobacteria bacterium]
MESWLDQALADFETDNAALVPHTRSFLSRIVPETALHARLINTLSLLEHLGSHKIMTTQHGAGMDQATLRHVAEEAHHAYFMKRQAEKAAERPLDYVPADLLAPAAARMYFQRLEAAMLRALGRLKTLGAAYPRAIYLYMSLIVEFRALWFYELYEKTLKHAGRSMSLKRMLGEERNHLHDVAGRLAAADELSSARTAAFLGVERTLYGRLLSAMQAETE